MILPDVLNTMLMGMIFMVVLVTVVRPLVLNVVGNPIYTDAEQQALLDAMYSELERRSYEEEAKRSNQIRYQQLLLELPPRLQPKPLPEPEPELVQPDAPSQDQTEDTAAQEAAPSLDANGQPLAHDVDSTDAADALASEGAVEPVALGEGEIEIREGETLADIKERMKQEQRNAKKPAIPPELLNNAKSYEDKVTVVRMVVHQDQSRVAAVIRDMIQTK